MKTRKISHLQAWMLDKAIHDPEAYSYKGEVEIDEYSLKDGSSMYATFYGEGPRKSNFPGTEGIILTGHIHLQLNEIYTSYLPTYDGAVLRVMFDDNEAKVLEGPSEVSPAEQIQVISRIEGLI